MKKITLSALILSALIFSCSKSEEKKCSFSKENLKDKTYFVTISKWIDSNGLDLTNAAIESMMKDTCDRSYYTFKSDGTYINNHPCDKIRGYKPESGNWTIENINNIFYLNLTNSNMPFIEGLIKVESYDCNSFSIAGEFKGDGYFIIYKFIEK